MTRSTELRELNDDELTQHLAQVREEAFNLRFQLAMGKQDNSARLGHVRREVARVLTLQTEREHEGARSGAVAPATRGSARPRHAAGRVNKRKVAR